ncbi:MAG: cytochrome c3 family protein [Bryobacteraceae bacterium]
MKAFRESPMGRSFGVPSGEPAGNFTHALSGSHIDVFWKHGKLHHKVEERGVTADYPIAYYVGAGSVGRSYLVDLDGHLFQSPASYFTHRHAWGVSPGYETERTLDFSRAVGSGCLHCHAGASVSPRVRPAVQPLSCERCHGPSANHLRDPVPGSIVNPARLPRRERDSVCEQCHLEGATAVLNPGKTWWDFRPGEPLETAETLYVYRTADGRPATSAAVSQAEQLAGSMCVRASGGKLWCGSCHNPHGPPVRDRKAQIRRVCESCHSRVELARSHTASETDCVSCHMPRLKASDIAHATITDHRLLKRPKQETASGPIHMAAWHKPAPDLANRNLGLAYFHVAKQKQSGRDFEHAYELLSHLTHADRDAPVQAALGYMLLGSGQVRKAVAFFDRAAKTNPASAEYWLDLGVAQNAAGDPSAAVSSLRKSIQDDPYDYRPYEALSRLYASRNQGALGKSVLGQFLKLVPQSLTIRLDTTR